jgi:hypothetical protein
MKRSHQAIAIAVGGSFGGLICYGLRAVQLDMDHGTRNPAFTAVTVISVAFGFGIGAVCGLFLVPGKNPWRW